MNEVLVGDARHIPLPDESVHLVMTSPPYWSLRDYGVKPSVWGGDPGCQHAWALEERSVETSESVHWQHTTGGTAHKNRHGGSRAAVGDEMAFADVKSGWCQRCGAWRGCLGLEPTPDLYVEHMVEVFREVKRVLRPDGVLALNLGDSYAAGGLGGASDKSGLHGGAGVGPAEKIKQGPVQQRAAPPGLKPKDKLGIPDDVVKALRADGWWWRQECVWIKRNAMPESAQDRPTTAHEFVFLLTKSARYAWDADAIRVPQAERDRYGHSRDGLSAVGAVPRTDGMSKPTVYGQHRNYDPVGRNFRTSDLVLDDEGLPIVYVCNTQGFAEAHFATFPTKLVEPFVKAGCPQKVCPQCGTGWVRVVEKGAPLREWQQACGGDKDGEYAGQAVKDYEGAGVLNASDVKRRILAGMVGKTHTWRPFCSCSGGLPQGPALWRAWSFLNPEHSAQLERSTVRSTALDPFAGSGTVGVVCARQARHFVGLDLSPKYIEMANERIRAEGLGHRTHDDGNGNVTEQLKLFGGLGHVGN